MVFIDLEIKELLKELKECQTRLETKFNNINERLTRIESDIKDIQLYTHSVKIKVHERKEQVQKAVK